MANTDCKGKPKDSPLHKFEHYGHNDLGRGRKEVTEKCSGCGMKVTT